MILVDTMESETEFKAKMKNSIQDQEFLSLLSPLTEEEKLVVRVLIIQNQAIPLKTIRNEAVKEKALRRKEELIQRAIDEGIKEVKERRKKEQAKAGAEGSAIMYRDSPESLFSYKELSKIFADLHTVEDFERALKSTKIGAPSLNIIKHAVENLTGLPIPFVDVRPILKSKRIKNLYYLSPIIYDVWKAQRNRIVTDKNYKPLPDEEYWFML